MKFSSNFRPNSVSVNPHKLTPGANTAVRGENGNSSQAAGPVSPVAAEWLSEAEEEYKEWGEAGQQAQMLLLAIRPQFPL